ncbi:MAG: TlpA disulfide reductase family protein [Bacteroidia bacterium]
MKKNLSLLLAVLILIIIGYFYKKYKTVPSLPTYQHTLLNEKGEQINLTEFKGTYLLVSYFQTWCGDCIEELASIDALQSKVGKHKLSILMISDEPFEKIMRFKEKYCKTLDFYQTSKNLRQQKISVFPTTYLLNDKGEVIMSKLNVFDWDSEEVIAKIIK